MSDIIHRPRRTRRREQLRSLVRETRLAREDFILPLFACPGEGVRREISSMPGVYNLSVDEIVREAANAFEIGIMSFGELTPFTCPDCHGALARLVEGDLIRYRCHTGHAFTASTLLAEVSTSVEDMLWQGMRGMEEMNLLLKDIETHLKKLGHKEQAAIFNDKAEEAAHRARIIHDSIFKQEQYSEDIRYEKNELRKAARKIKRK